MTTRLFVWLKNKWASAPLGDPTLVHAYHAAFSNEHGVRVLQHLLDRIYFRVYEGKDPNEALVHNARRTVVQEILENIDMGEHPEKYHVLVQTLEDDNAIR